MEKQAEAGAAPLLAPGGESAAVRLAAMLPPGDERERILELVRLGEKFAAQQRGRRPGFLRTYVAQVAARLAPPPTFEALLDELATEAARRELHGEQASPVEKVNRIWEVATIHMPRRGPQEVTFKTLRNLLTPCRKK